MGRSLSIMISYGTYHDRVLYWDLIFNKSFIKEKDVIIGGELNFSLGVCCRQRLFFTLLTWWDKSN